MLPRGQACTTHNDQMKVIVGMTGFEPAASCSQSKRPTKLGYIPLLFIVQLSFNRGAQRRCSITSYHGLDRDTPMSPILLTSCSHHVDAIILIIVGMAGFEPAASSSRTKRPTKLGYIPMMIPYSVINGTDCPQGAHSPSSLRTMKKARSSSERTGPLDSLTESYAHVTISRSQLDSGHHALLRYVKTSPSLPMGLMP